jgi:hypothetical protein
MPLTRADITASSRLMLVVYPVFSLAVGLSYILGDPHRTASPSFDAVRDVMPMQSWGWVFVGLTALKALAWVSGRRRLMILALCVGLGISAGWAFGFAASWYIDATADGLPEASFNAIWLWAFVSAAHVASLRSLTLD